MLKKQTLIVLTKNRAKTLESPLSSSWGAGVGEGKDSQNLSQYKLLQMGSPQKNTSAQCFAPALGITELFYLKRPTAIKTTLTGPF